MTVRIRRMRLMGMVLSTGGVHVSVRPMSIRFAMVGPDDGKEIAWSALDRRSGTAGGCGGERLGMGEESGAGD